MEKLERDFLGKRKTLQWMRLNLSDDLMVDILMNDYNL